MNSCDKTILDGLLWAERVIKKHKQLYNDILEFNYEFNDVKFNQKIYNYYYDIKTCPRCKICGDNVNFHNKSYNTYCSNNCTRRDPDVEKKRKDTFENTMLDKYGVRSPFKIPGIRENIILNNIIKWGFDIPSKSKQIKEKISKTKLSKSFNENLIINNKRKETNLYRWDVDNVAKLDSSKSKAISTNLDTWGVEHPIQLELIKEKRRNNFYNKEGVNHHFNIINILEKMQINRKKTLSKNYLSKVESMGLNVINYENKFIEIECDICKINYKIPVYLLYQRHCNNKIICINCNPLYNKTSSYETEILNFLIKNNIENCETSNRTILNGKELDIYLPSVKVAIEFNGLYWHSEIYKDNKYHLNKTIQCNNLGIDLFHIFEDDWLNKKDIVKSILKNKLGIIENKIYSNKCEIRLPEFNISMEFLNNNHIKGYIKYEYILGLYYKNELVSIMTFGCGINNTKEVELIQFCNKINTIIVGSASKLFRNFLKIYDCKYDTIIYYDDISMFDCDLYKELEFYFVQRTEPNYYWIVDGIRSDNNLKLIDVKFYCNKTDVEIMHDRGYYRIWDCGCDKYLYNKQ